MAYIYLAGIVDPDPYWGDISLSKVSAAVDAARADDPAAAVTIVLNSPGGDVAEGLSIYNYLRRAKVNIEISGMAASIASIIALAGQHVAIYDNSTIFIHHAWAFLGESNANEARTAAERMDAIDEQLASVYASRGLDADTITGLMDGTDGTGSLITSARALELGLVDEILDPAMAAAACLKSRKTHHITSAAAAQPGTPTNKEESMDPEKTTLETDAECGDPQTTETAAEETTVETTETVTDDPDDTPAEELEELKKELEEVKKELAEAKAKLDKSAKLANSVHKAQTSKTNTQLSWPELVKKLGYVQARAKYPNTMKAYCEAELAKGSIR